MEERARREGAYEGNERTAPTKGRDCQVHKELRKEPAAKGRGRHTIMQ
jgi:hypothetical protein